MGTTPNPRDMPKESRAWARDRDSAIADLQAQVDALTGNVRYRNQQESFVSAGSGTSPENEEATELIVIETEPGIPSDLAVTTDTYFDNAGLPRADILLTWENGGVVESDVVDEETGVLLDTELLLPAQAVTFEVWYRKWLAEPTGPNPVTPVVDPDSNDNASIAIGADPANDSVRFQNGPELYSRMADVEMGQVYAIKVRGISASGILGPFTDEVLVTPPTTVAAVLPAPSTPVLTSSAATVTISWNGILGSAVPAPQFRNCLVQRYNGSTWVVIGTIVKGVLADADVTVGQTYQYRLVAEDVLGQLSPASTSASILVIGVEMSDLDNAVSSAISTATEDASAAFTLASGKNKITYASTTPVGSGTQFGDTWYQRTAGVVVGIWEWTAGSPNAWVSRSLDGLTLVNLNANNITTGFLNAGRIAANSISAQKLLIAGENLIGDPYFTYPAEGWSLTSGVTVTAGILAGTSTSTDFNYGFPRGVGIASTDIRPATVGTNWRYQIEIRKTTASTTGSVGLRGIFCLADFSSRSYADVAKMNLSAMTTNTWYTVAGTYEMPAGKTHTGVAIHTNATGVGIEVRAVSMMAMASGNLVVDGAIDGKVITGATVQTNTSATLGVKLDSLGIRAYTPAGVKTFDVTNAGLVNIIGELSTGTSEYSTRFWGYSASDATSAAVYSLMSVAPTGVGSTAGGLTSTARTYVDTQFGITNTTQLSAANKYNATWKQPNALATLTVENRTVPSTSGVTDLSTLSGSAEMLNFGATKVALFGAPVSNPVTAQQTSVTGRQVQVRAYESATGTPGNVDIRALGPAAYTRLGAGNNTAPGADRSHVFIASNGTTPHSDYSPSTKDVVTIGDGGQNIVIEGNGVWINKNYGFNTQIGNSGASVNLLGTIQANGTAVDLGDTGWISLNSYMASGFSSTNTQIRKVNGWYILQGTATGSITAGTSATDIMVGVPSQYRPVGNTWGSAYGSGYPLTALIRADGTVAVTNRTAVNNPQFTITWPAG